MVNDQIYYIYDNAVWCRSNNIESGYGYRLEGVAVPIDLYVYNHLSKQKVYLLYNWGVLEYTEKRIYNIKNPVAVVRNYNTLYIATKDAIMVEIKPEQLQLVYEKGLSFGTITDIYVDPYFDDNRIETYEHQYNELEILADGKRIFLYNNDYIIEHYDSVSFVQYGKNDRGNKTNEVLTVNDGLVFNNVYYKLNEPAYYPFHVYIKFDFNLQGVYFIAHENLYLLITNIYTNECAVALMAQGVAKVDGNRDYLVIFGTDNSVGFLKMDEVEAMIQKYNFFPQIEWRTKLDLMIERSRSRL